MKYLELFLEVLKSSITLTCLVMIMMLLIEFINVGSAGKWMGKLKHRPLLQIVMAALLGLIPGCIGGFAIVSLFTHNLLGFGALVAGMIATFGDEAFVLMAYSPQWTLILSAALLLIAFLAGGLTHLIFKNKKFVLETHGFELHEDHENEQSHEHAKAGLSFKNLKSMSFSRALLVFGLMVYIIAILTGALSHQHGGLPDMGHTADMHAHMHHEGPHTWENVFFMILACITLVVVALSSEHFLQSHLWEHVIKHHFLSIFLWTFGVLLCLKLLYLFVDVDDLIGQSQWALWGMMLLAVLIGLIPESGPHLIFVMMFMNGSIPFGILLVSSIVQDGHGALPLLAQSRKNFFLMKGINMLVGLLVGVICILLKI